MGIDGLTVNNLGIIRDVSAVELLNFIKRDSDEQAQKSFKEVENSKKTTLDPDARGNQQENHQHPQSSLKEQEQEPDEIVSEIEREEDRKYRLTCNLGKECVEIIDLNTNKVIETISISELKQFFTQIKNPSGILVDQRG